MAKVKITGHASGSGVITVTAPNTSTDRTITLPDATATIATTADVAARLPSITDGGNATAITIDSSENVGIGRSPLALLHLQATVPEIRFQYTGNSGYAHIKSNGNNELIFSAGTTDGQERMRIDSTGAVTMPAQPAFNARASYTNIQLTPHVVVNLDSERFDVGSNLASNTFTAPVTGKYLITYHFYFTNVDASHTAIGVKIQTSNKAYEAWWSPDDIMSGDGNFSVSGSQLCDMDANDTMQYKVYCAGGTAQTDIHTDSTVSGFLAC